MPLFIRKLRLDGFLSFPPGSEPIELGALNVIIGPNGSGKSNILHSIDLLHCCAGGKAFREKLHSGGGAAHWIWKGSDTATIDVELGACRKKEHLPEKHTFGPEDSHDWDNQTARNMGLREGISDFSDRLLGGCSNTIRYGVTFSANPKGTASILEESLESLGISANGSLHALWRRNGDVNEISTARDGTTMSRSYKLGETERRAIADETCILSEILRQMLLAESVPSWYASLNDVIVSGSGTLAAFLAMMLGHSNWRFGADSVPRMAHKADEHTLFLQDEARNLAAMVQKIKESGQTDELYASLRLFLPRFEELSTRKVEDKIELYLHEQGVSEPIHAAHLSDGTLRFIALLVLLHKPEASLIWIEEPELGLHPDAMHILGNVLVQASQCKQIIVTTHSDALLSAIDDPDCVLVCNHLGGTVVRRLDKRELKLWVDEYRVGDLWRMGLLGGNP
ncbi:MAG: AAA family ATPase [Polyangiaceae bacterium]|nr:AAA family ATPase [Polyangiaceae bacterium]